MPRKMSMRAARIDAGYTQQSMAKALNISRITYGRYEKHPEKIPYPLMLAFCKAVMRDTEDIIFLP